MRKLGLYASLFFLVLNLSAQSQFESLDFTTTTSGLSYKISDLGKGKFPQPGERLWVHYMGFLASDSLFSSSIESGPLDFYLGEGQVIKGWEEGLQLIKPGGSIVLKIPPELAYGNAEYPGIPAGSTLYFEIALLQVNESNPICPYSIVGKEVVKDDNGFDYVVVKEGVGKKAQRGDNAYVHYSAYLNDTNLFDSSIKKGDPVRITVGKNQIIKGWDLALLNMNEGSKLRVCIPTELAYGSQGLGNVVPPNAEVVLDLEMVKLIPEIIVEQWNVSSIEPVVLSSGLRYYILNEGEGELIAKNNIVAMHYSGYLENGVVFDSSVKRAEEFHIPVGIGAAIKGWDEGLLFMRKGAKFQLHVPAELGFGEEGDLPHVPKNASLIYDIEILDVF